MAPFVAAALAALPIALGLVLLVGPFVLPLWLAKLNKNDRERLLAATKGAVAVVDAIAKQTPIDLDDKLAQVLKMVEAEIGKTLKPAQKLFVSNVTKALRAKA